MEVHEIARVAAIGQKYDCRTIAFWPLLLRSREQLDNLNNSSNDKKIKHVKIKK